MPNDAKLGLAVGVSLVIAVAVIYYRADSPLAGGDPAATIVQPAAAEQPAPPRNRRRTPTTTTAREKVVEADETSMPDTPPALNSP